MRERPEKEGRGSEGGSSAVRAIFEFHGLAPSESEIVRFEAAFPLAREMAALLHAMPEIRDEDPALVFDAAPSFSDWSDPWSDRGH